MARTITYPTGTRARPGRSTSGHRSWLRIFLRIHRRRHQPMGPGAVREHHAHRAAARFEGLLLRTGHGRPRHRAHPHAACDGAGQAVAALLRPGTAHAPHHAPKDWIAKFKGKFDQGWDKVREETFARQKELGVIPAGDETHGRVRRASPRGNRWTPTTRRSSPA